MATQRKVVKKNVKKKGPIRAAKKGKAKPRTSSKAELTSKHLVKMPQSALAETELMLRKKSSFVMRSGTLTISDQRTDELKQKEILSTPRMSEKTAIRMKETQNIASNKINGSKKASAKVKETVSEAPVRELSSESIHVDRRWQQYYEQSKGVKPVPYTMAGKYEVKTPIMHNVLGWGYILNATESRIEVLFKDGIKTLIANYR